jgi:hypothetical protein
MEISNISGQKYNYKALKNNQLNSSINVSNLPKGMYFLNTKMGVKKFLKE